MGCASIRRDLSESFNRKGSQISHSSECSNCHVVRHSHRSNARAVVSATSADCLFHVSASIPSHFFPHSAQPKTQTPEALERCPGSPACHRQRHPQSAHRNCRTVPVASGRLHVWAFCRRQWPRFWRRVVPHRPHTTISVASSRASPHPPAPCFPQQSERRCHQQ